MSQILKLTHENQQLKRQINQYQQVLGVSPYVNDSLFKGGYRVVKTIVDRDAIKCCWRKQGMKVVVIGEDYSYKEYVLKTSDCNENIWEEINLTVEENEVNLIEDYSTLEENLKTQKDLNLVLKDLILNLQSQIDNIELTDEKVQITEDTSFAQIGQTQKDFNKNVSDYKTNSDLKNQEQDNRLTDIESENIAQNDLINDLQISLDNKLYKGTYTGTAQDLKNSIDGKLNKPTTTGNTNSYPYVVGEDGNGNSARLPAGDLGKNFFNSDLSNTTARNHTMNAGVTVNTLGNPYSLTGLPNKEADPSFNKAIRINSSGQLGLGDTQQFNITVPDVITSNNNLSIAPLTVNHIYPNPVPNITTYVQDLQNIMATIGNLNFIKMSNWVVNTNNPTNSSQLIAGDGLVSFNLGYSQSAYDGFPVASVASQANLFPANKNFVIFFNISATVFASRWGAVLAGMSQSDDNTSIIVPTLAYANSNSSNAFGWSSGSQENILSNGQNGSVFIVKSGQVIFVVICNNSTGLKVVASFDANVNGGDYRFVATMIQKDIGSSQPLPLTEVKYWIAP